MPYLTRVDPTKMDFGWDPAQRVSKITAALNAQRANLRTAPAGSIDADTATRNVDDLKQTLERAEVNEAARTAHLARLDAERKAQRDESAKAALDAQVDQLRVNYLSQPGATEADFEKALPRLLERQREDAALNAPAVREQQLAEAKRRLGPAF